MKELVLLKMQPGSPAGETREQVTDLTLLSLLLASTHSPGSHWPNPTRSYRGREPLTDPRSCPPPAKGGWRRWRREDIPTEKASPTLQSASPSVQSPSGHQGKAHFEIFTSMCRTLTFLIPGNLDLVESDYVQFSTVTEIEEPY